MSWETDLLAKMGASTSSPSNVTSLQLWAQSEGVPDSWNNWLATTQDGYGGINVNSDGVKAYPTESDGVAATWATLQDAAYKNVVSAFRQNQGEQEIWDAINASPWCGGCQSGHYPVALYDYLYGGNPPTSGSSSSEPTLKEGDTGTAVRLLQSSLNRFGAGLTVDGDFGAATLAAVKQFQSSHGLTVDGVVGPATWAAIDSALAGQPSPVSPPGQPGGAAPYQPPGSIDGSVQAAWSALATRTGADANGQLAQLAGFADVIKGALK